MIWFVIGAGLGALQLARSSRGRDWREQNPALFTFYGALLGAGFYGTILWLVFDQWFGIAL